MTISEEIREAALYARDPFGGMQLMMLFSKSWCGEPAPLIGPAQKAAPSCSP